MHMNAYFVLIPLLVVLISFTYGVARTLIRLWLDHRMKIKILEKVEANPALAQSPEELQSLLEEPRDTPATLPGQDYRLTGLTLLALGILGVIAGRIIGLGNTAVGIYLSGFACIVLGLLIAAMGVLFKALGKTTLEDPKAPDQASP